MQAAGAWGAGDWLMSLLGVVILSFGFKIFGQRRLMKRHAPEIFGSVILSAAFSLLSTAFMCRVMGLSPGTVLSWCFHRQGHMATSNVMPFASLSHPTLCRLLLLVCTVLTV